MRHKYSTTALVLSRHPIAEAGMLVTLLTPELGLVRARAEGVRRSGAKLAHALQTLHASDVMLVRGKEGWRLTGALLSEDCFSSLTRESRLRAGRVAGLLLRLVNGELAEPALHSYFYDFVRALPDLTQEEQDGAESLVALRLLHTLGSDAGILPPEGYTKEALDHALAERKGLIVRINRGITTSGL